MNELSGTGAVVIEGHVQGLAITRTLGYHGIPVIVVDTVNCLARYSKYCTQFYYCPAFRSQEFITFLVHLSDNEGFKSWTLFPSNDHIIKTLSENYSIINHRYKGFIPDIGTYNRIYNKTKFLNLAADLDIPHPAIWSLENIEVQKHSLTYPLILKGKFGLSFYKNVGKKAVFVEAPKDLEQALEGILMKSKSENILIQELIPEDENNKTISFTAFCINGIIRHYWCGRKLREHPWKLGTATFAKEEDCSNISAYATRIIKNLSFTGTCEIEFLYDKRDKLYKLIEMNARTWLWVGLAISSGVNFPMLMYNHLNNFDFPIMAQSVKKTKWMHILTDLYTSLMGILRGKLSIRLWIKSYKGEIEFAVFSRKDIKPFIMEIVLLPWLILRR